MGKILIWLSLAATAFSFWYYLSAIRLNISAGKKKNKEKLVANKLQFARYGYYVMTTLITLASMFLLYLIITHQFQYEYVYKYSARNMSFGLLLSTFWAGQAGSFLLWAFYIAVMGVIFLKKSKEYETYAMLFLNVIMGFFIILLLKASPFNLHTHAPADGQGLNPLLQNFWMVIHPPVLFLGYAAVVFPFVLALAALCKKQYSGWVSMALPWSLFNSITLGAGIILGGYWAYGTLGWGGYWGWDPVENSSLVPWLVNFALFHGLLIEKVRNSLKRTNFILAALSFVLVIYATFLTRSGVLADFSVHSFQDFGINELLILFLSSPLIFSAGLFAKRFSDIQSEPLELNRLNRENTLFAALLALLACSAVILAGTSFPLISSLFTTPSNVNISFYNQVSLPFAIIITLILGVTPFMKWGQLPHLLAKKMAVSTLLSLISVAVAAYYGLQKPLLLVFVGTSALALWTGLIAFVSQLRVSFIMTAAPMAHVGVALMFIGIIVSGNFTREQYINLHLGQKTEVLGAHLTYNGIQKDAEGKDVLKIEVQDKRSTYLATPRYYFTTYNNSIMKEPFIQSGFWQDFYISPIEVKATHNHQDDLLTLKRGETVKFHGFDVRFVDFEMHDHGENGTMQIGAKIKISNDRQSFELVPNIAMVNGKKVAKSVEIPLAKNGYAGTPTVALNGINATEKMIQLIFDGFVHSDEPHAAEQQLAAVQVSRKPFMNILWIGTALLTLGTIVSFKRRLTHL